MKPKPNIRVNLDSLRPELEPTPNDSTLYNALVLVLCVGGILALLLIGQ